MFWILFNKKKKQEKTKEYFYSTSLQKKSFFDERHPKTSLNILKTIIKKKLILYQNTIKKT